MTEPTGSFRKVNYELRPAKQVERRMLLDALQLLSMDGFPIRDYQYTGMGSIYFVDYVLFHKILGIGRLVSVEVDETARCRVGFNRPFSLVEVRVGSVGDYIPQLSKDRKHILWLDYDDVLNEEQLRDVALAGTYLSCGSVLLVTVDSEPPVPVSAGGCPTEWKRHFQEIAPQYLDHGLQEEEYALSRLPRLNARIIDNALRSGMAGRDVSFSPLFFFVYKDGHRMLSVGGMVGERPDRVKLRGSRLRDMPYYRDSFLGDPFEIRVPRLTRKERLALDAEMPCPAGWSPSEFELLEEEVAAYREIYRFFPAYAELLL